jgi:hypothetical protein
VAKEAVLGRRKGSRFNSTKSPVSGVGNVSKARLMSEVRRLREAGCV